MPNVHATKPKAVRLPDGLEARVKDALADGETVNGFIVAAIEERLEREGGSTAPAVKPRGGSTARKPREVTAPAASFAAADPGQPKPARRHALNCKCGICRPA